MEVTLEAGDALLIPEGFWHQVDSTGGWGAPGAVCVCVCNTDRHSVRVCLAPGGQLSRWGAVGAA